MVSSRGSYVSDFLQESEVFITPLLIAQFTGRSALTWKRF